MLCYAFNECLFFCYHRLNNRKARLARAGKDVRAPMEVDITFPENQVGQALQHESPESPLHSNKET